MNCDIFVKILKNGFHVFHGVFTAMSVFFASKCTLLHGINFEECGVQVLCLIFLHGLHAGDQKTTFMAVHPSLYQTILICINLV